MKKVLFILFATLCIFISLNSYAQEINPGDGVRISFLILEMSLQVIIIFNQTVYLTYHKLVL